MALDYLYTVNKHLIPFLFHMRSAPEKKGMLGTETTWSGEAADWSEIE
jgi:hypothetical protein